MPAVAKALIFDAAGHVLVLRRSNTHPTYALHHDFPGGELEPGETAEAALVREVFEEAGLRLPVHELRLGLQDRVQDGSENYTRLFYVAALADHKPSVILSWEHDRGEWLSVPEIMGRTLPSEVDPCYLMAVQYLQDHHISVGK